MQVVATRRSEWWCSRRPKASFSGNTSVAPRPSDAILEARRPCADGLASEDGEEGAVATMVTIVATTGPPHQDCGKRAAQAVSGGVGVFERQRRGAVRRLIRDAEEASDGEILVELRPVDAEPAADQLPAPRASAVASRSRGNHSKGTVSE